MLPVLFLLMFNAIDGGRLIVSWLMLSNAAIAGARVAAVSSTAAVSVVQNAVVAAAPLLNLNAANVSITGFAARAPGSVVTVTVSYTYQPLMPSIFAQRTWTGLNAVTSGPFIVE